MKTPTVTIPKETDSSQELFSKVVKAGRRTYFFDVKTTRNNDHYIVITESRRRHDSETGVYEKQKLFLYKEDFNKFLSCLKDSLDYIETCNPLHEDMEREVEIEQLVLEPVAMEQF